MEVREEISRREKRGIKSLRHNTSYKICLWISIFCFSPVKKFIRVPIAWARKAFWVISVSIYKIFWLKIAYIDDFIVHKKLRGKWYWEKLFNSSQKEAEKENCDYLLLISRNDRKASHKFYKKTWLTIIGLWIWIIAYKKMKRNK